MLLKALIYCFTMSLAPADTLEMINEIPGEFTEITCDNMGFLYALNSKNNVLKFNLSGDTLYTFEDKSFPVDHVDAFSGLKVLVYNSQQNIVAFLDKTLSFINAPIQLDNLNIPISYAVAASRDNNFWVFDEAAQELKKYDQNSKELNNSGNLTLVAGKTIQPTYLKEKNSKVYLLDSIQGVFQFDHLGTFIFQFKKITANKIEIKGDKIIFLKDKELYLYDTILLESQKIDLGNVVAVKDFTLSNRNLLVLTEQNIQVYRSALK